MNKYLLILISCIFSLAASRTFAQADAEVSTFASPDAANFCPGVLPITINIYNNDLVDITALELTWTINTVPQPPVTWTGTILPGEIMAVVLDPGYNFVGGEVDTIEVTIQTVNTLPDPNTSNDIGSSVFQANQVFAPMIYWDGCSMVCLNETDYLSIQWYKDGLPDPNAPNSGTYTPNQPGSYSMVGLSLDSCDVPSDTAISVNPPTWDITALGPVSFCEGDSVGLVFTASEPVTFTWNTGSSLDTIYAVIDGWHTVNGTTVQNGCPVVDSFFVTVHPLPAVTISDMNDTLVSNYNGGIHQWYLDGNQIGGAQDSTYVPTQSGIYYVTVTDIWGCVGTSNSINWIFPGIAIPVVMTDIMIYPNPASDLINIKFNSQNEELVLEIYDLSGRLVQSEVITGDKTISISSLEDGVYNCIFKGEGKVLSQKLVKTF